MDNKRKRVLVIGYLPPPYGGLETVTQTIIGSDYLKDKFELSFLKLTTRRRSENRGELSLLNIAYSLKNIFNYIFTVLAFRPQIVYTPIAQNKTGFARDSLFIIIGKLLGSKISAHFHGGNFDKFYENQLTSFKNYIKNTLKKVDTLIVLAEQVKIQFKDLMAIDKVKVIYNCIDLDMFNKDTASKVKKDTKQLINIIFVSYISKAKGAVDFVKAACNLIKHHNQNLSFKLIGPVINREKNVSFINDPHNGYADIMRIIQENKVADNIKIVTSINQDELHNFLYEADIFAFPSHSEGFGLVVLEAMTAGLPIVMSKIGGLSENLREKENCLFIKPGDVQELTDKLRILIENPQLRLEMGQRNKALVSERFNTDRFYRELEKSWVSLT